ncbi:MAG TPA: ATP-binding protein, partial [Candidatus Lokiarchaeia archaeon]
MILKDTLRELAKNQRETLNKFEYGIEREVIQQIDLYLPFAIILSGVRRCGKSTLLLQLIRKRENYYFFNFEDPRIVGFEVSDFQKLNDVFQEEFGTQDYYFFDEIQNVQGWEIFISSMLDKGKKIVITGSNASLLSKELGTRLTGRHLRYELFPFSYTEMLTLLKINPNKESFEDYLKKGGFPEFLKNQKEEILRELFYDIVIRDIVVRHKIRNLKTIKELGIYLLTNIGKEFSYNNLKKTFNLGSIN